MLEFFRKVIKAISSERSTPPKPYIAPEPLIPPRLAELFARQDVWSAEFQPDKAKIPDGCNFILWFESDHSPEELLKAFEFENWQAQVGNCGFTLTQVIPITDMRSGRTKDYQINMAAFVAAEPNHISVLAGNCTYSASIGAEFRALILQLEGQSNNLFCLYSKGSALWREVPATAEMLGMNSASLSDADNAVLNTGYIVQIEDAPANCSPVKQSQRKVELISPSVLADEEGYTHITCWPYPGRRLWKQVHEVALYPEWGPNFMFVHNYVWIKGDGFEDFIPMEVKGLLEFITRLVVLPGFSSKDFEAASKRSIWIDEEVVWRRPNVAMNEVEFPTNC